MTYLQATSQVNKEFIKIKNLFRPNEFFYVWNIYICGQRAETHTPFPTWSGEATGELKQRMVVTTATMNTTKSGIISRTLSNTLGTTSGLRLGLRTC